MLSHNEESAKTFARWKSPVGQKTEQQVFEEGKIRCLVGKAQHHIKVTHKRFRTSYKLKQIVR